MDQASWNKIRTPGFQIRRLHQVSAAVFHDCLQHFNLTPIQYTILVIIDMSAKLEQTSIAARAGLDNSTVADVIKRLEKNGMVRREVGVRDKRARVTSITELGKTAITDAGPFIDDAVHRMLSPLDPAEQDLFLRMIDRVLGHHLSTTPETSEGKPWQRDLKA